MRLNFSTLYLFGDQRFRGYCLLVFDRCHAESLDELTPVNFQGFMSDLQTSVKALRQALNPDHMNVEQLGNSIPHLHWHIIPRYRTDPRWGRPAWEGWPRNEFVDNRAALEEDDTATLVESIRNALLGQIESIEGS